MITCSGRDCLVVGVDPFKMPDGLLAELTGPSAAAGYRIAARDAAASYAATVSASAVDLTDDPPMCRL